MTTLGFDGSFFGLFQAHLPWNHDLISDACCVGQDYVFTGNPKRFRILILVNYETNNKEEANVK